MVYSNIILRDLFLSLFDSVKISLAKILKISLFPMGETNFLLLFVMGAGGGEGKGAGRKIPVYFVTMNFYTK